MKNKLTLLMLCASLTGCQQWIKPDNFADKFRIGSAHGAYLGSIGIVSGTGLLGGYNQYTRHFVPNYHDLVISKEAGIDFSRVTFSDDSIKADVKAAVAAKDMEIDVNMEGGENSQTNIKAKLHILSFSSPIDAVKQLNELNPFYMENIKSFGEDARIISKVLVALNYEESSKLEAGGTLKLSGTATPSPNVAAKGDLNLILKNSKNQTINLDSGAIIGYTYDILCWKKDADNLLIAGSVYQKYGVDEHCRGKLKSDPSDLK